MGCFIHQGEHIPPEATQTHHKVPRAYGGLDDEFNLVDLCSTCHDLLHRSALRLYSGKAGQAKDIVVRYLPDQPARVERLWKLVQTVAQARQRHVRSSAVPEAGVEADHQSVVKMQLELPDWLHHRYKALSTGQGLNRYVLQVLENHAQVATQKPGAAPDELFGIKDGVGPALEAPDEPRAMQPMPLSMLVKP